MQLFGLLIFNFFLLLAMVWLLRFLYDLLFQLESVFLQHLLSFLIQLLLQFSDFSLLANGRFELSLFSSGLLFQHLLLLHLLLGTGHLQFSCLLGPDFCLLSLFFTSASLIGFNGSLCSQCIKFGLSIWSLLLQLSEPLDFLLFLIFDSSKITKRDTFVPQQFRLLFGPFPSGRQKSFLLLTFPFAFFVRW